MNIIQINKFLGCIIMIFIITIACSSNSSKNNVEEKAAAPPTAEQNYIDAKLNYISNPTGADALIWFGRRAAYLGYFDEAIDIYTDGIQKHPEDARMLRHRGHRYISTRKYDLAITDFEAAVKLIKDQPDQVEPDGLPNERNIPIGTLHGNIWYHLGLAYYLQNDMENALRAYSNRTVLEKYDDNLVSGGHWLYMILRRMDQEKDARAAIAKVHTDMDIIENHSYFKMCQFYNGNLSESQIKPTATNSSSDDVLAYGLGNWHLYNNQDTASAKVYYEHLFESGNKYSFAYLAGEADWLRLFGELPIK